MTPRAAALAAAAAALLLAALAIAQTHDTTAPTLTAYNLSPTTIDTYTSDVAIAITFTATDDLSGFREIAVCYTSPTNTQTTCTVGTASPLTLTMHQYAAAGDWKAAVHLTDNAGNQTEYSDAALATAGFNHTITVE